MNRRNENDPGKNGHEATGAGMRPKGGGALRMLAMGVLPLIFLALGVYGYDRITRPEPGAQGAKSEAQKHRARRKGPWGPRYGRGQTPQTRAASKPVAVAARKVQLASYTPRFSLYGQVIASHRVVMGLPVSGRIIKLNPDLREGARVEKGAFLVTVDDFPYRAVLEEARANLAEAKAKTREISAQLDLERETLKQLEHQLELARREQKRAEKLISQGTISQKILDDAVLLVSQRQVAVQQRRSNIDISNARLEQQGSVEKRLRWAVKKAERTLRDTRLAAPFDGRILSVNAEIGQYISSSDKLVTIVSDSHLEVRFTLSEDRYGDLLFSGASIIGLPVRIRWRSGRIKRSFQGKLTRLAPEVAADSGAIVAFAGFENGGEASSLLRIGSFVDIELSGRKIENVARLPESALYNQGRVYLVQDNRLVGRKVRPLRWENGEVLISAGLDEGDLVLVNHLPNIKPDIRVKVVQE